MKLLPYKVESFGRSDIGLVRTNNEDVFRIVPEKQFYILADGMGGHNAGEIAALTAVNSTCSAVQALTDICTVEQICTLLREAMRFANETVYTLSHNNKAYSGMGTTLSCFALTDKALIYAHVGDSRLYRMRKTLKQLSEDHSLRRTMLVSEERRYTDLPPSLYRNILTKAIGTHPYVTADIGVIPICPDDIYMLCSDGLTDCVPEEVIAKMLIVDAPLEEIANQLIQYALEKGGNDNITILLVKIVSHEAAHLPR